MTGDMSRLHSLRQTLLRLSPRLWRGTITSSSAKDMERMDSTYFKPIDISVTPVTGLDLELGAQLTTVPMSDSWASLAHLVTVCRSLSDWELLSVGSEPVPNTSGFWWAMARLRKAVVVRPGASWGNVMAEESQRLLTAMAGVPYVEQPDLPLKTGTSWRTEAPGGSLPSSGTGKPSTGSQP